MPSDDQRKGFVMVEILSEETLRLLRDKDVQKTVREVLDDARTTSKTVTVKSEDKRDSGQVTVRRLST